MIKLTIEHHAVLFALLSRAAIEAAGERGRAAVLEGMTRYGNERGRRMAKNALAHGDELTVLNSQVYGEWKPDHPGQMEFGVLGGTPTLKTYISKCAWCDAWAKHGLTEYGKLYCVNVDNAWFQGFNPAFLCTPTTAAMSWGGARCEFDWGEGLTASDLALMAEKKKALGTSCMRDFNFHTAHILSTIGNALVEFLGEDGERAIARAKAEYVEKFGREYLDALEGIVVE